MDPFTGMIAGLGTGLIGGVASQFLGRAFAPQLDVNQITNPYENTMMGRQIGDQGQLLASYNQQPFRDAQLGQMNYLQQQAQGTGPSIAQQQGAMAQQQLAAQQMAQAQSAGGMNAGLAQRLAMQNTAQGQAGIGSQTQIARLQEIQQANQLLAQAMQGARGQDLASQGQASQDASTLANAAFMAQQQRLDAQKSNMGLQSQTAAAFGNAISGGMAGAGAMMGAKK